MKYNTHKPQDPEALAERKELNDYHALSNTAQLTIDRMRAGKVIRCIGSGYFLTTGKGDRGRSISVTTWSQIQPFLVENTKYKSIGIREWRLKP